MRPLSGTAGSISIGQTPGEAGDFTASFAGEDDYKILIDQANTVPLQRIFRLYGIRVDQFNRKIICPFKSHKGGRESTPSFWYYPETNSFCCYGCNTGNRHAHGCEFIAAMDGVSKIKAARRILDLFGSDIDEESIVAPEDFSERFEIMMDFSNTIREFRQTHLDEKSQVFIEKICQVYDRHNLKRTLDNEALRRVVEEMKEKITLYTP